MLQPFVFLLVLATLDSIAPAQITCITGTTTWVASSLGTSETGSFSVSFDVTPQANATDANVALSQNTPANYTDLAAIVRFNNSGNIDARNGATYAAAYTQPYTAGATYHIQMVVNVAAHTYTVYVTPPGGAQTLLASNYAFRTEQANATSLNYWTTYEDPTDTTGPLQVCNFNAASTTASISPSTASLSVGGTQQFAATVTGTSTTDVTWSTTGGTITTSGRYTAPSTTGTYMVTATSMADTTKSASAVVTVTAQSTCTTGSTTWAGYPLGTSETGSFTASFDVTPQANGTDANVALSQNTPADYTDLAAIVRFNDTGNIDARNGSAYAAAYTQPYTAGATYHIQMLVNAAAHTYTVYVTPPGGTQTLLASNYAFRTEQANATGLNYWTSYEDATDATGPLQVCNFNLAASTTVSISPTTASLAAGGAQQFTATVTGTSNTAVTWSTTGGTITTAGLYTAPNTAGTYTVTATSVADTTKSASATVTVATPPPSVTVSISPTTASLQTAATQQFTATVTGTTNTAVSWSTTGGTITTAGLYTAPSTAGTYTVTATSVADATKSASATVTVTAPPPPVTVSISPTTASLQTAGTQQFTATVTGTSNTTVTWSTTGGTITTAGLYTAPSIAGTYTVTATSAADTTKSASATVTVTAPPPPVTVAISPTTASLQTAGTQQFNATVAGTTNTAVSWSATGGTITTAGLYTAPNSAGTYTVTATSAADSTKSASATVTVTAQSACTTGSTTWAGYPLGASETGSFAASFDVTPQANATDANIALSQNSPADYIDLAAIVRFNNTGNIDARNGSAYAAAYTQPYTAGATYHIQMLVNVAAHTYTVYVTPPGGAQALLASNYAFRTEQANATSLNYWTTYEDATGATGPLQVCNFNAAASTTVSISPSTASLTVGGTQQFTATVTETSNTVVTWSTTGGTITTSGLYTAPNTAGTYTVTATSVADTTKSASATVTVGASPTYVLNVSPASLSFGNVVVGNNSSKTATLSNSGNSTVTVSSGTTSGPGFSITGLTFPFTVAAGRTATVTIQFAPQASGSVTGSASFASNATNSPTVISLSGSGVTATQHSINLTWTASTSTVSGYNIYRGTQSGGPYVKINSTLEASTAYTDSTVQSGTTYYYVVTAVDSSGAESSYSNEATAVVPTP